MLGRFFYCLEVSERGEVIEINFLGVQFVVLVLGYFEKGKLGGCLGSGFICFSFLWLEVEDLEKWFQDLVRYILGGVKVRIFVLFSFFQGIYRKFFIRLVVLQRGFQWVMGGGVYWGWWVGRYFIQKSFYEFQVFSKFWFFF